MHTADCRGAMTPVEQVAHALRGIAAQEAHRHNWSPWLPDGWGWARACVDTSFPYNRPVRYGCGRRQWVRVLMQHAGMEQP